MFDTLLLQLCALTISTCTYTLPLLRVDAGLVVNQGQEEMGLQSLPKDGAGHQDSGD